MGVTDREWGWEMWSAIERSCRTTYGYSSLDNADRPGSFTDGEESFFFAETVKYAYLLLKDDKLVDLTKKVFNTEAHPLDVFSCVCFNPVKLSPHTPIRQKATTHSNNKHRKCT